MSVSSQGKKLYFKMNCNSKPEIIFGTTVYCFKQKRTKF